MSSIQGMGGVQAVNIQGLDLESALMAVQSNRANLLESQLKSQIDEVQKKNDQIAKLNQALGALNALAAKMPSDAKAGDKLGTDKGTQLNAANAALRTAGSTQVGQMSKDTTKGDLDGAIQTIKSQIDGMSNSQQMDMLRLQSLSNKRNEAFDIMTNFIKKMQENRSSIIGNMR